jgi:hypothetical protein
MTANLGLVAAILLMAFGAWRFAGSPGLPGSGDGNGTIPAGQFAMQPATPANVEAPASIATPTPTTACEFSADIPIFNGVDESPVDGAAVLLTTTGDVVLTCPEEPQPTVLLTTSTHNSVAPLEWPGAVMVPSFGEKPEEARTRVVSLLTGDVVEFGVPVGAAQIGTQGAPGSPWLVGPAPNDTADVQILDLRTMHTRLLSDIAGTALPEFGGYLTSSDGAGGTLVFGLQSQHTNDGNGTLVTDSGLPGDLLVLNGSLDAATWMSMPEEFPAVVGFDVSPDGTHVALHGASKQFEQDREDTYTVVRLRDGKEIERSSTLTDSLEAGEGIWVQGGGAFAYIDGNALMILPIDVNLPEQPVFEADGPLSQLRATADESTVLVSQTGPEELATMTAMGQSPRLYAVNTTSARQSTMFPGIDVSDNVGWETPPDRFLVTFDYQPGERETVTYQVIDAVTGATVGTIDDVPLNDRGLEGYPKLGRASVAEAPDGNTELIAFDSQHTYLMQLRDGEYRIEQVLAPEGILAETPMMLSMYFAPSGSLVSMSGEGDESGTSYVLDVTAESPAWQAVTTGEGGYLPFVPGTGALPVPQPDLGFDFSEVPDGSEFLDHEGLATELRVTEDNFAWPAGYDPDIEAMIENIPADDSRYQEGMAYTMLGGYNQCAWYQTWLDAHEAGDKTTETQALRVMTDVIPYFPNHDPSPAPHLIDIAASAAEGDPDMVQQMVTVNCQGMFWEDAP